MYSFFVDGADEAGTHCLVQWILHVWKVACGCHLSDPSCQYRRRLSRLPLELIRTVPSLRTASCRSELTRTQ